MITKIKNSVYSRLMAMLILSCFMFASFTFRTNEGVVLNSGKEILLATTSPVYSELAQMGEIVKLRVLQDVKIGDKVVIREGTPATGQVMRLQKAKGNGKPGIIEIQLKSTTAVDGQEIFLSGGNIIKTGEDKSSQAMILAAVVCILFLTMKGEEAIVNTNHRVTAYSSATVTINVE